ncbi:hypothetical protein BDD43_2792 [Mucilaginibacter gracilis]|uniref:Uncharacterized protein n=1 Tax=Mucilaginibacter gracilis TaxID=423350 RepID=A0A495J0Y6_9SPHI|nr:hypothetical protein [Mucilaginibacter gracilis]RKR82607.1 hypothetical protein BDD43_2792 [Mucilaginibacter gracilis]
MKPVLKATIILACLICSACHSSSEKTDRIDSIPKPLQDNSADVSFLTKRGGDNMVDAIYYDLVKKRPELRKLEDDIERNGGIETDSLEKYHKFNNKIDNYYSSAYATINLITDSVVRKGMKKIIDENKTGQQRHMLAQTNLITKIEKENSTLNDSHAILKLLITLPIINQYQAQQQPGNKALDVLISEKQKLINRTKSLTPKNKTL